ncbi:hypothetical protein HKBW3S03_00038 [Candidatus Hakubella thermalkaliphila]|uniref:Uncharacterized protein n=1 Tax=Candidatus Hakubella thermalkaliphila TaxID=2754717 RepID=A0A6V8Q672_9ACTN|nr:hypothetical protein [Candidatus Hakubella thermalkaliphila]MBT9168636.1 hypothetical protein [Bacillota bacterium]GFP18533.1 hypothetical protein HKBW3S03_00038 [Candidatus Hakubella thermalkaliphila]GFP37422.1 hypothetical protein HKBW3S44_01102 [Candidatus Hakubella thermalkaliphila]GFP40238.1 hypothetical protein HKBW3S47_01934 [Candidatus Hakubella thermalkaliphila]GFP43688.1 hypothetical protein HKBW3C_02817 [Candidatus Hakubella thermalkaliphila]
MAEKEEILRQTALAFDFIQKLYLEVSYLIKEIEGTLQEEDEKFVIGRPAGYGISARSSTGLESNNVSLWLLKKFAVFFVSEEKTKLERGQTITELHKDLKVLYLRIVLNDKNIDEPIVYLGVLYNIEKKPQAKGINKFESIMGYIEYNDDKIFKKPQEIDYEDAYVRLQGELIKNNLYDINDSQTLYDKIIKPSLELYRKLDKKL